MEMDLRTKLCLQVGMLMVANIELGHQVEVAQAAGSEQRSRADKLQADAEAAAKVATSAAASQQAHDAAADARDLPGGAPVPQA